MNSTMHSVENAARLIKEGKKIFIAADESIMKALPPGDWVGGSIPYFMAEEGGLVTRERVFITQVPDYVSNAEIVTYDESTIRNVYAEGPKNGFSFIILPAASPIHLSFAINAPTYEQFAHSPLVGWISGVHLSDLGKKSPVVMNGRTGEISDKKSVVMKIELPDDRICDLCIINIFSQANGDKLEFLETGFSAKEMLVNGNRVNFADYLIEKKADVRLPLVADYFGTNINISFQSIDEASKTVNFYAPVFPGVEYRQAGPVQNYVAEFTKVMPKNIDTIVFSCNCILNFLYSELEGKKTGGITGPITFGEVAYQLLNQTMVYLKIDKI